MVDLRLSTIAFLIVSTISLTGHTDDGRRELSFDDALKVTLAQNGDVYVARVDTLTTADDVALAESVYAPKLVANARASNDNELGSPARLDFTDRIFAISAEVDGRVSTGATYSLSLGTTHERYFSPFVSIYDPTNTTALTLSFTQPLLRGGGRAVNKLPIVIAALRHDLSEQQLRARLEQVVGNLEIAYWELELAYKTRDARQSSLRLAQDQLAESTRLVRLGSLSDLDVVEARAGVGRTEQALLRAEEQITEAQGKLRDVIIGDPSWKPDDVLVPTDDPEVTHSDYSVDEHVKLARANRPDIVAAVAELQAQQAAQGVTQNELLPQLDLVATGGLIGFAGELDAQSGAIGLFGPTFAPDPHSVGGAGQALQNLVENGNYVASVALRLELPLVNSAARARNDRQLHAMERAQITKQSIVAQIDNEVRNAVALLRQDEKLEKAADDAVAVDTQLVAGMRKRFSSGASTSFDVLRVADQLAQTQIEAARARVNYRISLARLALADGTLLQQHNITFASLTSAK